MGSRPGPKIAPSRKLGKRVQARRQDVGYRRAVAFAEALGWNASVVSRLEAGTRGIFDRDIEALCSRLRVEPAWLEGDDAAVESAAPAIPARGSLERTLVLSLLDELVARREEEIASITRLADLLRDGD